MPSPKLTFEEIIDNIRKRDPGVNGKILVEALVDPGSVKFHLDKSKLNIEIDLDWIWSVESLKKVVTQGIERHYK